MSMIISEKLAKTLKGIADCTRAIGTTTIPVPF